MPVMVSGVDPYVPENASHPQLLLFPEPPHIMLIIDSRAFEVARVFFDACSLASFPISDRQNSFAAMILQFVRISGLVK